MVKTCAFAQNHHTPAMNTPLTAGDSMSSREIVPIYIPNRTLEMNQEIYSPHETVTTEGRDRIRDCIARALSLLSEEDYERYKVSFKASDPSKVAAQVEAALFQFEHSPPDDDKPLEVKRPVLLDTLRHNKDLRRQVLFGEITPKMVNTYSRRRNLK
ncbi:hypothetical protein ACFX2I_031106 [Malus domestica]